MRQPRPRPRLLPLTPRRLPLTAALAALGGLAGCISGDGGTPPDTAPPAVHLQQPAEGQELAQPALQVVGFIRDDRGVQRAEYSLNGGPPQPVALTPNPDGSRSFGFQAALAEGANRLRVVAYDAAGNAGAAERRVTYRPPPPLPAAVEIDPSAFAGGWWDRYGPTYDSNPALADHGVSHTHLYGNDAGYVEYAFTLDRPPGTALATLRARLSSNFPGWSGPADGESDVTVYLNGKEQGTRRVMADNGSGGEYRFALAPADFVAGRNVLRLEVKSGSAKKNGLAIYYRALLPGFVDTPISIAFSAQPLPSFTLEPLYAPGAAAFAIAQGADALYYFKINRQNGFDVPAQNFESTGFTGSILGTDLNRVKVTFRKDLSSGDRLAVVVQAGPQAPLGEHAFWAEGRGGGVGSSPAAVNLRVVACSSGCR
ncbi:hypothetical protein Mterra_03489 [Calidithermus terrae]|uniref:Uncharacterized protein n=1 Tax=Calidithermus terrae TaxID=1408545 RepID=A0A399EBN7_9DEIN|nr:hypothetical protein [Calidithermus terrae]RIH80589.1 hypothetical protein Mterra_03489 [Calidithermus terrae]